MKRKIKFRAWDSWDKTMSPIFGLFDAKTILDNWAETKPDTGEKRLHLMQYTSLKDKNGKDIYEGDILKWTHPNFRELKQEYKILEMSDIRKSLMIEPDCRNGWIEIIGNIYENPELIK